MKLLLHFCAATKKKSSRASIIKDRSSDIRDDIVEEENVPNETDLTQPYDEMPNYYANRHPLPNQNLNAATREEPPMSQYTKPLNTADAKGNGSSDDKASDSIYTIRLADLCNHNRLSKHDYLTLQPDDDDCEVKELAEKYRVESGASTSISDLYAKVHKKGYRPMETKARENLSVEVHAKLQGCKPVSGVEQLSDEQTKLVKESTEENIKNYEDRDDEDVNMLGLRGSIANKYAEEESSGEDSSREDNHVLSPDTREPNTESATAKVYTKL